MPENTRKKINVRIAELIIDSRYIIFLIFAAAAVFCALSLGKVKINSDLRSFLPADSETRRGIAAMSEDFTGYASMNVMINDISVSDAYALQDEFLKTEHVSDVAFSESEDRYKNGSALFGISFDGPADDEEVKKGIESARKLAEKYDCYISGDTGISYISVLAKEMGGVIAIAAVVIIIVLLFTSRSYFEVVIFIIVFAFAALLNMGTNFLFGEISAITNSVAIILQLALAIDYAIIFAHRYQDEAALTCDRREALVKALSRSITEISSSSLTTISGLIALTLMQFRLGYDLGVVLAKGIICSMLTVFLLMPGLIMLFSAALKKSSHRFLVPDISGVGKLLTGHRSVFVFFFIILLPFAFVFSGRAEYAFNDSSVSELIESEERSSIRKIKETFGSDTAIAMLVPAGSYDKEGKILEECAGLDGIKSSTGLAGIKLEGGTMLTEEVNAETVSSFLNIPMEQAELLFKGYSLEHGGISVIFGGEGKTEAPLVDILLYLLEKIDDGTVTLSSEQKSMLDTMRSSLERGVRQLHGKKYDRLVFTSSLPAEGEESVALLEDMRNIATKYFDSSEVILVGDMTSARDLKNSYKSDSLKISILTIVFVFIILLFTFRNIPAALTMIFVIQGSIWINFSFTYLQDMHPSFVTHMIVSAIQMGATIDYAIVYMNRFLSLSKEHEKKEAAALAVGESFPTVFTSGAIMTAAGLLIAYRVSDVYVGHIGLAVGRGALISAILVLTVLPRLCVLLPLSSVSAHSAP